MASVVVPFPSESMSRVLPPDSGAVRSSQQISVQDVKIKALGRCLLPSPVAKHLGDQAMHFVGRADQVLVSDHLSDLVQHGASLADVPAFELAGPRNKIFFDPRTLRAGIVTCGGLCPGLNNVIRGIVLELMNGYGVKRVYGFKYGYEGIIARFGHEPVLLTAESVASIHHQGGTILGSSRGGQDPVEVVDALEALGVGVLFSIGGDGTTRGAIALVDEVERRGLKLAIVGVPKTIDNDFHFIDRSFGFESAYSAAVETIRAAKVEAVGAARGIGLVKLMGRHSGFVACHAALASTEVDLVLIPEVKTELYGSNGVLAYIDKVLARKGHAVIVTAEGTLIGLTPDQQSRTAASVSKS